MSDPTTIFISAGEASGEALRRPACLPPSYAQVSLARAESGALRHGRPAHGRRRRRIASSALKTWPSWASLKSSATCPASTASSASSSAPSAQRRPTVAVLIDFPEIHFRLAEEFHRLGVPVIYFVSPQLWAWKKHRIKLVQKYVRRMLVIFPFEEQFYRERGVDAEFVGHPLADLPLPTISREQFAAENGLDSAKNLDRPASRQPRSRKSATTCPRCSKPPSARPAPASATNAISTLRVPPSPARPRSTSSRSVATCRSATTRCGATRADGAIRTTVVDDARAALFHARASVVASGTATVEAALIGNPFVVVYRVSPLTYAIAKRVVKVPHVAMANLIAGKRVVPELIQHDFTAANIVQQLEPLLPDGPRSRVHDEGAGADSRGAACNARPAGPGQPTGKTQSSRVADIVLEEIEHAFPCSRESVQS